jgi:chromosome segregation ATPase
MVKYEDTDLETGATYVTAPLRSTQRKLAAGLLVSVLAVAIVVVTVSYTQGSTTVLEEDASSSESAVALGARIRDLQSQITKISMAEGLEKRLEVYSREQRAVSDRMYDEVETKNRALENLVEKDQLAKAILALQKRGKDAALEAQLKENGDDEKDLQALLESLQKEQLAASDLAAQSEALIHIANVAQQRMEAADRRVDTELDKLKRLQESINNEQASIVDIEDQLDAMKEFLKNKDDEMKKMTKLTKEEKEDVSKDFDEWELEVKDFEAELTREKTELEARQKLVEEQRKEVVNALAARQLQELDNTEIVLEMENLIEGKTPEAEEEASAAEAASTESGSAAKESGSAASEEKSGGSKSAGSESVASGSTASSGSASEKK